MSANHNQDFDAAVRIIETMKDCGADAVKIQTYTADTMTIDCDNEYFRIGDDMLWAGRNLYDLYKEAYTPWEWQPKLQKVARDLGMDFFSTPYDDTSVEFLKEMDIPLYKIASFEVNDIPLIKKIAAVGKPIIMSTGMATLEEIEEALATIAIEGNEQVAILKCTSAYPAPPEEMHLITIPDMQERFGIPIGLSDHTLSSEVAEAAVALGACIIEKHFTLSQDDKGPDSAFSLEPDEFKAMVDAIRTVESNPAKADDLNPAILGAVQYGTSGKDKATAKFRRSLFVVEDMQEGEEFTHKNIRCIRPADGLAPKHLEAIIGKQATANITRGTPLVAKLIDGWL